MHNQLAFLVGVLLRKNNIQFDKKELTFQIKSHPSFPSIYAVTAVLDHFGIENIAARIAIDENTLPQLPQCFIAQLKDERGNTGLAVVSQKNKIYQVITADKKRRQLGAKKLLGELTGIILAVNNEKTIEAYKFHHGQYALFALVLFITSIPLLQSNPTYSRLIYLVLSLTGFIISVVIIRKELGLHSKLGALICSSKNKSNDCNTVISSNKSSIIKGLKFSDLCLAYFSTVSLVTLGATTNLLSIYLLGLLAVPITFYSIYLQRFVLKSWCSLCLLISATLWGQAIIAWLNFTMLNVDAIPDLFLTAAIFTTALISWRYVKPFIVELQKLRDAQIKNSRFKRNFKVFAMLLKNSQPISTYISQSKDLVFGNKDAELNLLLVTNPYCGHCKPVHGYFEKIRKAYGEKVKITIRFNIHLENPSAEIVKITSRLLELYEKSDEPEVLKALDEIYVGANPKKWLENWGECTQPNMYFAVLQAQKKWCLKNAINFTPSIFINGRSYPEQYNRDELIFFIEDLEQNNQIAETLKKTAV